jgi:EAL domain-containing protein (putative c-di-GMP-specific phosphodiesterase class I)
MPNMSPERWAELREGLEGGQFVLHYQPICDLRTGELVGFEALARWQRPNLLVMPGGFLKDLTHSPYLGEWLEQQIDNINQVLGPLPPGLWVSVNLSTQELKLRDLDNILGRCDYPQRLHLEITEAVVMSPKTMGRLRSLHRKFTLKADDIGVEQAGFDRFLDDGLFQAIKLDGSLTRDILTSQRVAIICAHAISLARALGITAIAEWVETEPQRNALLEFGADCGQGKLFGLAQPMGLDCSLDESGDR